MDEELAAELARMLGRQRGYASFFEFPDKEVKERGIVRELLRAVPRDFPALQSLESSSKDPPDCVAFGPEHERIAFEVTELVDQSFLESVVRSAEDGHGRSGWAEWDAAKLLRRLAMIVDRKGKPAEPCGGPFDQYVLVVHTAEPGLEPTLVTEWLKGADLGDPGILTRGYLLFDYMPARPKWPNGYAVVVLPLGLASP